MNKKIMPFINIYSLFTIFYYFFGRYDWEIPSYSKLFLWIIILLVSLNMGYYFKYEFTFKKKLNNGKVIEEREDSRVLKTDYYKLFVISCLSIIIFQVIWVVTVLGEFNVINIFESLGSNYYERLDFGKDESALGMQIRTLFWGLTLFAYPIGFVFFNSLKLSGKILLFVTILIDMIAALNMGISKNIGDIVIIYILSVILKKYVHSPSKKKEETNKKKILIVILLFLTMFGAIQQSRDETKGMSSQNQLFSNFSTVREDTFFDVMTFNNVGLVSTIDRMGVYVSHGYTGLAFSLETSFQNTYGLGFSRALMDYARQYLGIELMTKTYMSQIEASYGWPNGMYWSTAYVWFASATSFLFLPLAMFFFGYILSKVEKRFSVYKDVYSLAFLAQLFIQMVYLPANAQIFQSRSALIGIITLSVIYVITGRKIRR
ncbi:hypothetical protein [Exiguobacterium alkaliphilum]|uniref:hypothetical protein n=1 Tax=Exiguobacterium alkaliphilum TaxID=1428684 RepID=UPI001BAB8669|nr:hypothetical protein [Exiguobacterium alkaliphilum]QUE87200.1 hypothetical protein KB235_04695 [Exiguobacterium alkaliphilum]